MVRTVSRGHSSVSYAALIPQKEVLDETRAQVLPPGFWVHHMPFAGASLAVCIGRVDSGMVTESYSVKPWCYNSALNVNMGNSYQNTFIVRAIAVLKINFRQH